MTKTELNTLTPEQKRVKIAEACGWKNVRSHAGRQTCRLIGESPNNTVSPSVVPDYLNDLNAMHEAERRIGIHDRNNAMIRCRWLGSLRSIVAAECPVNNVGSSLVSDADLVAATSAQRADAFLLTLP